MKKILIALGVIAAIVVAGVAYLYSNLDSIIKTAVEESGSRVTKVEVTLGGVNLDLTNGKGGLENLQVGNPDGFKTDYAFALGGVNVAVDTSSINSDVITIKEVTVDGPKVIYELAGTKSNIATIQSNVDAFTKTVSSGGASDDSGGEGPKLVIENLYVRDGEVAVSADFLQGKKMGVPLPTIHLTNIGKDSGGATPAEVAAKVLSAVNQSVIKSVSSLDLKGMMEGAGQVLEGAGSAVKGGGEGLKGAAEEAGSKLKGLIGN
ncbi:hypothetical protein [Aestuariispira ectoiniformans]|uniref:hypothetical protein n=1 Tax=Aestuariispira ectoiniformans TaxID=2775080 RepID=UPI00223C272D|nr:hypothetical protein [Aestuariispira ectoiniformans]